MLIAMTSPPNAQVLSAFRPGKVTITIMAEAAGALGRNMRRAYDTDKVCGYLRTERQYYEFAKYNLNYGYFVRDKASVLTDSNSVDSGHASGCETDDESGLNMGA